MGTLRFLDAAYPLSSWPAADGVAFYIGGDTPHVWSQGEIDNARMRYRLPIFVRSNPPGPGAQADVNDAVNALKAIGAPPRYKLLVYGSQSSVFGNQTPDDLYWGADWIGSSFIASGDVMTQWVSFSGYDESTAESTLPFWDTTKPVTDQTCLVAWDMETAADAGYIAEVYHALQAASAPVQPPPDPDWYGIVRTTDPDWVLSPHYQEFKVKSTDKGQTWQSGGPMTNPVDLATENLEKPGI